MPALFESFPIYYVAKNEVTGLTDVIMHVKRPDGVLEGPFTLTEVLDVPAAGTYKYDYTPGYAGTYLAIIDSATQPKRAEKTFECRIGLPFAIF